jgi:hypothetical protein
MILLRAAFRSLNINQMVLAALRPNVLLTSGLSKALGILDPPSIELFVSLSHRQEVRLGNRDFLVVRVRWRGRTLGRLGWSCARIFRIGGSRLVSTGMLAGHAGICLRSSKGLGIYLRV